MLVVMIGISASVSQAACVCERAECARHMQQGQSPVQGMPHSTCPCAPKGQRTLPRDRLKNAPPRTTRMSSHVLARVDKSAVVTCRAPGKTHSYQPKECEDKAAERAAWLPRRCRCAVHARCRRPGSVTRALAAGSGAAAHQEAALLSERESTI